MDIWQKYKRGLIALPLLALVLFIAWRTLAPTDDAVTSARTVAHNAASEAAPWLNTGNTPVPAFTTGLESLPASLQGTEVDGELPLDKQGRLIVTRGVRNVFDYFLTLNGEEDLSVIVARIRAYLHNKLHEPALAQANRLLDSYLAYLNAARQVNGPASIQDTNAVRQQQALLSSLRLQFFSAAEKDAFFADEEAYDNYTLQRMDILHNKTLSAAERQKQLAAAEQQLPAGLREQVRIQRQYQDLTEQTNAWQQRGGSDAELHQIRETIVGTAATDRLEKLDHERREWTTRMDSWLSARDAVLHNPALSPTDRTQQLVDLRRQYFSDTEQVRVEALERMHDRGEKLPQ